MQQHDRLRAKKQSNKSKHRPGTSKHVMLASIATIFIVILLAGSLLAQQVVQNRPLAIEARFAQVFRNPDGRHAVLLEGRVSFRCGEHHITADQAVIWIKRVIDAENASNPPQWSSIIYVQGNVQQPSGDMPLAAGVENAQGFVFRLVTTEQVLLTAETRVQRSGQDNDFYQHALRQRELFLNPARLSPSGQTQTAATPAGQPSSPEDLLISIEDGLPDQQRPAQTLPQEDITPETLLMQRAAPPIDDNGQTTFAQEMLQAMQPYPENAQAPLLQFGNEPQQPQSQAQEQRAALRSTVHIVPQGRFISQSQDDGSSTFICTDGIYVYQNLAPGAISSEPALLELRAKNAVVFYNRQAFFEGGEELSSVVHGVYLEDDVVLQAGQHTFQASRLYYDFVLERALVLDAIVQTYVPDENLPLHVRAKELRLLSLNHFSVQQLQLSNDEFPMPGVWVGAQSGEFQLEQLTDGQDRYSYNLRDVTVNIAEAPIFWWPWAAGSSETTSTPLERVRTSYDSDYGISVETRWSLAWLLGANMPQGVEAHLLLDEFTKRGPAAGLNADYNREDYFGTFRSYVVNDHGQDSLGNFASRDDVEPVRNTRGRVRWQHRQYLPQGWEGTFELGYLSDYDFLESWEEREFDTDKGNETLIYFKQQRDNWAFDFLNKFHLNDFEYTMEELPTAGFHVVGQDLFNRFTYHHNGYIARIRERAGMRDVPGFSGGYEPSVLVPTLDQDNYGFAVSRHEISMPLTYDWLRIAPTGIGTIVWDDRTEDTTFVQGAAGFRASTQLSRVDNTVESRLWDLNRLRHIIIPETSVFWVDSDQNGDNHRDIYNFTLRQRWQTMRGPANNQYSVDFLRWNVGATLVERDVDDAVLPNKFFFASPEPQFGTTPIINADLSNLGLAQRERINQNLADHIDTDWQWIISPTTMFTGGMNINMHDGLLSQADASLAVQRSPRTSYALSYRFLNDADRFDRRNWDRAFDSEWLIGAASYQLNEKYTVAVSYHYDLARTEQGVSQAVLIRKIHHWYTAVSVGFDAIDDKVSIMFSIWPEGYDQFAIGSRRFTHLTQ